jgi:hypothetical protein
MAFFLSLSLIVVASTARRAATQSPALELIESDDARVQREGNWTTQPSPAASGGSYLYSASDALTLHFAGTRIEVGYVAHPALGTLAIEIDDTLVRTVITTSQQTEFDMRAVVDYLEPETHTLRVYAVAGAIAIDAFYAMPVVSEAVSLLSPPAALTVPTSPIVYLCSTGLCTMKADGSQRTVIVGGGLYAYPTWSPDGSYILYALGNVLGLLARDANGDWQPYQGGIWPYTLTALSFVETPAWSPLVGSNQIAFSAIDGSGQRGIHCLDFEADIVTSAAPQFCGSASLLVPNASPTIVDRHPTWSPDETWVAFESNRHDPASADKAIYKYHLGDAGPVLVIAPDIEYESYEDPDWSPDLPNGQRLAYAYYPGNTNGGGFGNSEDIAGIYTMALDGSDARQVILQTLERRLEPAWSPDGAYLVYEQRLWDCAEGYCDPEVGWMFTGMGVVTTSSGTVVGGDFGWQPDWSPVLCPEGGYPIWLAAQGTDPGAPEWTNSVEYIGRIADSIGGLYVYEAPVINAPFLTNALGEPDYLPWGSGHCVHARLAHEITYNISGGSQTYREVWYRISETASPGEWILAGVQVTPVGVSGIGGVTHIYINDWDVSQDPMERDPVDIAAENNPNFANPPATIPFVYNRGGAGEYARDKSVSNFADSLNCHVNNPPINGSDNCPLGLNRVALDDTLFKHYAEITGIQGATGSAAFMSQSIWHGGLPMILATAGGSCGQDSSDLETSGWRYCPGVQPTLPAQNSSRKWRHHEALIEHIIHLNEQAATPGAYIIPILSTTNTDVVRQYRKDSIGTWNDFIYVYGEPKPPDPRLTLTWEDFIERSNLYLVKEGDYMFDRFIDQHADFITNDPNSDYDVDGVLNSVDNCPRTENPDQADADQDGIGDACDISTHGFLVAGWGPVMPCADVEVTGNDNLNPEYDPAGGFVAPYVADFGLGGNLTTGFRWRQYPGPRPFYCVISAKLPKHPTDPNSPIDAVIWNNPWYGGRENEVWEFYRLPDTFSLGGNGKPFAVDRISAPNFELWQ